MFVKFFTAGIVGSALLAAAAFAQSPSTDSTTSTSPSASNSTTTSSTTSSYTGHWRASKVVGLSVYNDSNESLGAINDLLTDKSGKIVAVVVGVGGFLGVGERYVAIPFEKVKFVNEPVVSSTASSGGSGGAMTKSTTTTGAASGGAGGGMATAPAATPAASTPNPWYPDHAVISGTKDELKALPEFKYNNT